MVKQLKPSLRVSKTALQVVTCSRITIYWDTILLFSAVVKTPFKYCLLSLMWCLKLVSILLSTTLKTKKSIKHISSLKTWNALYQRNTFLRQLYMLLLDRIQTRRSTCALLRISSKWSVHHHLNVILSQVVSAWLPASSSLSNSMILSFTWNLSDLTSWTMMISTGTSVSVHQLPVNTKMVRRLFSKFKMKSIRLTTATYLGYADVTLWTRSLIWLGRSISIWKLLMNHSVY